MMNRRKQSRVFALGLGYLGIVVYLPGSTSSALFGDEWGRIREVVFQMIQCPSDISLLLRPLLGCYVGLLHYAIGNSWWVCHATSLVWVISNSIFLVIILDRIIPTFRSVSISSAAMFLVWPANYSRLFSSAVHASCLCWHFWQPILCPARAWRSVWSHCGLAIDIHRRDG